MSSAARRAATISAVFLTVSLLVFVIAYAIADEVKPALRNALLIAAVAVSAPLALFIARPEHAAGGATAVLSRLALPPAAGAITVALIWLATDAHRASPALLAAAGVLVTLIVALHQLDQTRSH